MFAFSRLGVIGVFAYLDVHLFPAFCGFIKI